MLTVRAEPWSTEALPLADLFAREANLDLVMLDLRLATGNDLRRIPASTWYRLQRAVGQTDLALLVLTPWALVPSAQLRLELGRSHGLTALAQRRSELAATLAVAVQRRRISAELAS